MEIKKTIERIPGGLMVVPLILGAALNTVDQMHLPPIQWLLEILGAPDLDPSPEGSRYEMLQIGGFTTALFSKKAILTLIALFLVCVGSQMNFAVGRKALKVGSALVIGKLLAAMAVGYSVAMLSGDKVNGFLGLSALTIIAAMSNGNGGMYAALTGKYGNRSDVGAISVVSINDGPFLTMLALGVMGESFPIIAFLAVLIPISVGFILGYLDLDIRKFLKPGEAILIPFFAFALGTSMNLSAFFQAEAITGGLFLGICTIVVSGGFMILALKIIGEKSQISAVAEASTAGNAVQTPVAIAALGLPTLAAYADPDFLARATAQISISTMTTAILCPVMVIMWDKFQRSRGIDGTQESVVYADHI